MSAIVDYSFYAMTYMGQEADEASFPALCARAEDVVGAMTRWQVDAGNIGVLPERTRTLYKKAVCAQVDYFAVNGFDSVAGGTDRGWTVGKVSVSGKSGGEIVRKGALASSVSPMVLAYLEQTGLMNPAAPVAEASHAGWWF